MPLLRKQRRSPSPPLTLKEAIKPSEQEESVPETVLMETSYDAELGSSQICMSSFPIIASEDSTSVPPLLDELNSDSDSSFDDSLSSQDFHSLLSKIHDFGNDNIEVRLDDGDSFYTAIMEQDSTTCSSSSSSIVGDERKVRFSTAEIREFHVIVGDHPGCAAGLPLSLDWKYNPDTKVVDLSTPPEVEKSTSKNVPRLTLLQRMKLLKNFHNSEQVWLAERQRRKALEEEGIALEQQRQEDEECEGTHLQRVSTESSLCSIYEDDDEQDGVPSDERTVLHPADTCDVLQCLDLEASS